MSNIARKTYAGPQLASTRRCNAEGTNLERLTSPLPPLTSMTSSPSTSRPRPPPARFFSSFLTWMRNRSQVTRAGVSKRCTRSKASKMRATDRRGRGGRDDGAIGHVLEQNVRRRAQIQSLHATAQQTKSSFEQVVRFELALRHWADQLEHLVADVLEQRRQHPRARRGLRTGSEAIEEETVKVNAVQGFSDEGNGAYQGEAFGGEALRELRNGLVAQRSHCKPRANTRATQRSARPMRCGNGMNWSLTQELGFR